MQNQNQSQTPKNDVFPDRRIVVTNALSLSMFTKQYMALYIVRTSLKSLPNFVKTVTRHTSVEFTHYIRHKATLEVVRKYLPQLSPEPNTDTYTYKPGDIIIVVALKTPQRGQEVQQINEDDLDVALIEVV